jgi:hypothetical protein
VRRIAAEARVSPVASNKADIDSGTVRICRIVTRLPASSYTTLWPLGSPPEVADQSALAGRAKDLLGVAVISTTITGVLANDKLTNVTKHNVPAWLFVLMAIAVAAVVGSAFYALWPRTWYFSPDPREGLQTATDEPDWPVDTYYASIAAGFTTPNVVQPASALDHNDTQIRALRTAVLAEIGALAILAIAGLALAWNAWR